MKQITPLHAVAAALLCAASLSVNATEPTNASTIVSTPAADTPVLVAATTGRPMRPAVQARPAVSWSPGERGARAAAADGPDALRRYIDRTRMIYALRFEDFAIER